jgi:hypothetical protein
MSMTEVRLQSEYWKSKHWLPDSEVVIPQPLLFPHYRNYQRDYNYFSKPVNSHHAEEKFDDRETHVSHVSQNIDSLVKHFGKLAQNGDRSTDSRSLEQNEESGNSEYERPINMFNNITWDTENRKDKVENHKIDFGLNTSEYESNDKNWVEKASNFGFKKGDKYRNDYDLDIMRNHDNNLNITVKRTSLDKHNEDSAEQNRNYFDIRPVGRQFSETSPIIVQQNGFSTEGSRQLGHRKGGSAVNRPSEYSDHDINTARQHINEEQLDGHLQKIQSFDGNHFSDFDTNRQNQGSERKVFPHRYNLASNRLIGKIWRRDFYVNGNADNIMQSEFDSKGSLDNIFAWNGDHSRSNEQQGGSQGKRDSGRNSFGKWHSHSGSNREAEVNSYQKHFDRRYNSDMWYSDAGAGDEIRPIMGGNDGDGNVHSLYPVSNSFGDVWFGDTDEMTGEYTSRDKQETAQNIFYPEGHSFDEVNWQNKYHSPSEEQEPGQVEFPFQEHGFGSSRNRFSGTSWQKDYSFGGEQENVPVYAETDGELANSQYTGANVPFHHGRHPLRAGTRVATSSPTAVTNYTLPNGTRVVRLRRVVLYRKLQTPPEEDSHRTLADIAKGILQKKVAKCT